MLKHVVTVGLLAGALALPHKAEAAFITGTLSFSVNSFVVNDAGTPVSMTSAAATGIDFTTGTTQSLGSPATFQVSAVNGSFATAGIVAEDLSIPQFGSLGQIQDFSFSGTTSILPLPPITGFQLISSANFSFDLTSISSVTKDTNTNSLSILALGILKLPNFQDTPGTFFYSTQGGTGVFSSSETDNAVPEPASMVLLGTGLIGLAVLARKRLFSH